MTTTRKTVIIAIVLILIVAGVVALNKNNNNQEPVVVNQNTNSPVISGTTSQQNAAQNAGSYESYAPEKLVKANTGDVVLFFRASWCPTCRALDADIKSNAANIPAGLTILDVNYDNSSALKRKYGVTYQHTLVQVDAEGNLIKKWTNSPTLSAIVSQVQ